LFGAPGQIVASPPLARADRNRHIEQGILWNQQAMRPDRDARACRILRTLTLRVNASDAAVWCRENFDAYVRRRPRSIFHTTQFFTPRRCAETLPAYSGHFIVTFSYRSCSLVVACTLAFTGSALANDLAGSWQGSYSCGANRNIAFTLDLQKSESRFEGTFRFAAPNARSKGGAYKVSGSIDAKGAFTFVPREWIERPTGTTSLGLVGRLRDNGLMIEGTMPGCGGVGDTFTASRHAVALPAANAAANAPVSKPQPPSGGNLQGHWRGTLSCTARRRDAETHDAQADIVQDGNQLAAVFRFKMPTPARQGVAETAENVVVTTGRTDGNVVRFDSGFVVEGNARFSFSVDAAGLDPSGKQMTGNLTASECQQIRLERKGASKPVAFDSKIAGVWTHSGRGHTDLTLSLGNDALLPFAELIASTPNDQPPAARDRLRRVLVPLHADDRRTVLVVAGTRDATGVFRPEATGPRHHVLSDIRVFTLSSAGAGDGLTLTRVWSTRQIWRAHGDSHQDAARRSTDDMLLTRADKTLQGQLDAGRAPPVKLASGIGGQIAAASSREDQCNVLQAWIAPFIAGADLNRMSIDAGTRTVINAFANPAFVPVFGLPFADMQETQRRSIWELMQQHCVRAMKMQALNNIAVTNPFLNERHFVNVASLLSNRAEADKWFDEMVQTVARLPLERPSLDRIAAIGKEATSRYGDTTPARKQAFEDSLKNRTNQVLESVFSQDLKTLLAADDSLATLTKMSDLLGSIDKSTLPQEPRRALIQQAAPKAIAIAQPLYVKAAAQAEAAPQSLDGLAAIRRIWAGIAPVSRMMAAHFGPDRDDPLRAVATRERNLLDDPAIQQAFRTAMLAVKPAGDPEAGVRNEALKYVDARIIDEGPGAMRAYRTAVSDGVVRAEMRLIDFSAGSALTEPGEPSAEDIFLLVHQRLTKANQSIRDLERQCLSGGYRNDPVLGIECLQILALTGGKGGMRVRLTAFKKISCAKDAGQGRYRCLFSVAHTSNSPLITGRMGQLFATPGVQDNLFIRNTDGWTMVSGGRDAR